jgi:perosamine synthetase
MTKNKNIPLHEPYFDESEKNIVKDIISSTYVSTVGSYVNKFEKNFSKFTKSKYCVATNSGTSALHLACKIIELSNNDEVLAPTLTFIAPINAIKYCSASPVFFDCDDNLNMNMNDVIFFLKNKTFIKKNKKYNHKTGKRIKAIIIVHLYGSGTELTKELLNECNRYNITIIEDAAESVGAKIKYKTKNKHVGTTGTIGCFSFNGNKIITTGAGGALITNNLKLYKKAKHLANQAKVNNSYIHDEIGFNYGMTNLQAGIGIKQLLKINNLIKKKKKNYNIYSKFLNESKKSKILSFPKNILPNYWLNIININNKKIKIKNIIDKLQKKKITVRQIWHPVHKLLPYQKSESYNIIKADKLYKACLCLPSSANLKLYQIKKICNLLK